MPPTTLFGLGYGTGPAGYGYPPGARRPSISYPDSPFTWYDHVEIDAALPTNGGGPITNYSVLSGSLPTGVSLNATTGELTGTPTTQQSAASVVIRAMGPGGVSDTTISVEVLAMPLSLGSSLAAWYKADAGCYTDAACLFASASSQYLSKTSPTFAPTTKMTIRVSINPTTLPAFFGICARRDGADNQFLLAGDSGGNLYLYIASGATEGSTYAIALAAITTGSWQEIVVVYDGTLSNANRVAMFVNGVAQSVTPSGTTPASMRASACALEIGSYSTSNFFNGSLARLGFSSLALSGAALTAAHTSTFWADMTAARQADWFSFYNLCEASDTRVDSTGLNNLTPTNGPTVAAGPGEGLAVNNSPVKRWESSYGTRHLALATISQQPIYVLNRINGRPTVRVQAAGGAMVVAGSDLSGLTGVTLSALMRTPDASADNAEILAINVVNGAMIGRTNPPVSSGRRTTAWDAAGGNAANDTPFVGTARFNASGQKVRKDAGADGTSAQASVLDGAIKYGNAGAQQAFEAAELVVVSTDLSDAVTAQLVSYMMTRGGI